MTQYEEKLEALRKHRKRVLNARAKEGDDESDSGGEGKKKKGGERKSKVSSTGDHSVIRCALLAGGGVSSSLRALRFSPGASCAPRAALPGVKETSR